MTSSWRPKLHLVPPGADFDPAVDFCADPRFAGNSNLLFEKHPYRNQDLLVADAERISLLANRLCVDLCRKLEAKHATGLGTAFWRTVLIRWMFDTVQSSWQRFVAVENAVRLLGDRELEVAVWP